MAGDRQPVPHGGGSAGQNSLERKSKSRHGGRASAGFFSRAAAQVDRAGSFLHAGPEAMGRTGARVYEDVPGIAGDFEFDREVFGAGTERVPCKYGGDATAERA